MLKNPELTVKVIAVTHFLGVPDELLPENESATPSYEFVRNAGQDVGSDMARLLECAGRTCYDSYGKGRKSGEYHEHVLDVKHGSVTEHASISFFISGVSRGLTHELVRHRAGVAYSQRSTRYVDESESPWIHHPLIMEYFKDNPGMTLEIMEMSNDINAAVAAGRRAYATAVRHLEKWQIAKGVDKLGARKQARGAARGYLGNALETSLVFTANIRALRWVIEQRASDFADAEIRAMAFKCYEEAREHCPEYFSDISVTPAKDGLGDSCVVNQRKV